MKLQLGPNVITSYKRLPYKAWYALAEFVDNSTQSYFNNRTDLDSAFKQKGEKLTVRIAYDKEDGLLRIYDNAMGMSQDELDYALRVGSPPSITTGRSKYGLGLKTAAFWMGDQWEIRTKKLCETIEHRVVVSLEQVTSGEGEVFYESTPDIDSEKHYTILEIREHNQTFAGRTIGKIKDYLRSMYRQDLRDGILVLEWRGEQLVWEEPVLLKREDGSQFYKDFSFPVDDREISGWVGILESGSRSRAGFSILQCGRVIRGWPNSWRPQVLYGQEGGSNNLVNQRLIGEIYLQGFDVSHTKDDILWMGDEEVKVEEGLEANCGEFARYAQEYRKGADSSGPSDAATVTAIDELKRELEAPEMVDMISLTEIPDEELLAESFGVTIDSVVEEQQETFAVTVGSLSVVAYVNGDMSPNDPYVLSEPSLGRVIVIVNTTHPHWKQLNNQEVLNYLRHCVYDAVAEWKARQKSTQLQPHTIKKLKDELLRLSFNMEQITVNGDDGLEVPFEDE